MLRPIYPGNWNFTTAAHLLNRAGFGGTPTDIERLTAAGPQRAVSWLLDYEQIPDPIPDPDWLRPESERLRRQQNTRDLPEPQRRKLILENQELQRQHLLDLRGWWLQRMAHGPRPFQEKMTLFWHGHFATSVEKVRVPYFMWRQNDLFRRFATGSWFELLLAVARDPAMLIWLDQADSRKEHPNENFAREVMELFALGEGHYTERDVTEAARALTGYSLDREKGEYVYLPDIHDDGIKTVLGWTGRLNGGDVLQQIVAQPQATIYITTRLWRFFAGEMPSRPLSEALAFEFRRGGSNFKPFLRTMLLSEEFYSANVIRQAVKSPVEWLIGTVRMLECDLPPVETSTRLLRTLGQDLFAPPNVKGWDGGPAWITTNSLLSRYNEAGLLVLPDPNKPRPTAAGRRYSPASGDHTPIYHEGVNIEKILNAKDRADATSVIRALEKRMLQSRLKSSRERALRDYLGGGEKFNDAQVHGAIQLIMSTPEYQLT